MKMCYLTSDNCKEYTQLKIELKNIDLKALSQMLPNLVEGQKPTHHWLANKVSEYIKMNVIIHYAGSVELVCDNSESSL